MTLHKLSIAILIAFISCGQPNDKKNISLATTDTLETSLGKKEKERLEKRRAIQQEEDADSLRLDKILQDALKIANQNINKKKFTKKYDVFLDSIPVSLEINSDYHFTKANPHLIIRRNDPDTIYIDIYTKGKSKFKKVVSHKQWSMTYVNDTIRDINGDGFNDFVVNWYGSSGCCLKAFSNVYLLRYDKKEFSRNFEFINPTFSPNEKIIRGVCYGHPGETEMYKYKWNGEIVDTLEYLSYERNDKGKTGKIIISSDRPHSDKFKVIKTLNFIPPEYRKVKGYDWFTGKGYE